MPLYFAYGSNMARARLEKRVGRVEDFGWASLHGWRHGFEKRGPDGSGKGTIAPDPADVVHGVLYALSDPQLTVLHGIEIGYHTVELDVLVRSSGSRLRAVTYRALTSVAPLPPTRDYLDHYVNGVREHGLPPDYLQLLLSLAGLE